MRGSFHKTQDGRYILKHIKAEEFNGFLELAPGYFKRIGEVFHKRSPSCLVKILGAYKIEATGGKVEAEGSRRPQYLIVMENLMNGHHGSSGSPGAAQPPSSSFFGEPSQQALPPSGLGSVEGQEHQGPNGHLEVYDLKGNKGPSRLRKDTGTKLDQDFIDDTAMKPMLVWGLSKESLMHTVNYDTQWLSHNNLIDYSLLVGADARSRKLVLGIIDYNRAYQVKERVENRIKEFGSTIGAIAGDRAVLPADQYQDRFVKAMIGPHAYFSRAATICAKDPDERPMCWLHSVKGCEECGELR